jgi:uncharacterized protein (UPF0305 family)
MSDHDDRLVELMSLMLDEMREMKQEQRRMRKEQEITNEKIDMMNTRLGGLEFVIREERVEFRSRIERLESAVVKAGFM